MPTNIWRNLFDRLSGGAGAQIHKQPPKSEILKGIRELRRSDGPFRIDWIFQNLFHNDPQICGETAGLIRDAMRRVSGREWLDQYDRFRYIDLRKKDVKKLAVFPADTAVHLVGVASLNGSGYVREAALDAFSGMNLPEMIPYVLLRLGDWVDPVREKAADLFNRFLPDLDAHAIARFRYIFESLFRLSRLDLAPLRREISDCLARPDARPGLFDILPKLDERSRLFIWRTIEDAAKKGSELKKRALIDSSAAVRAWSVGLMKPGDWTIETAERLLTDRSSRVRLRALQSLPCEKTSDFQVRIVESIFDDSSPVREMACWLLKQQENTDFAPRYRACLDAAPTPGAIAGLGETRCAEDIDRIEPFLTHERLKIRAAALGAIFHLKPGGAMEPALAGLEDSGNRVRRIAVNILMSVKNQGVKKRLRNILDSGPLRARSAALRVLAGYGGFEALEDILSAINDPNEIVVQSGWHQLIRWHGKYRTRMYSRPSKDTLARLSARIAEIREKGVEPPGPAVYAWRDLPSLLGVDGP